MGEIRKFPQMIGKKRTVFQENVGEVAALVTDPLEIGDHFQRPRHLAQIARHGMPLKQDAQAERFNVALGAVDSQRQRPHPFRRLGLAGQQGSSSACFKSRSCASKREFSFIFHPFTTIIQIVQ